MNSREDNQIFLGTMSLGREKKLIYQSFFWTNPVFLFRKYHVFVFAFSSSFSTTGKHKSRSSADWTPASPTLAWPWSPPIWSGTPRTARASRTSSASRLGATTTITGPSRSLLARGKQVRIYSFPRGKYATPLVLSTWSFWGLQYEWSEGEQWK